MIARLVRFIFVIFNGIVLFAFIVPYILTESEKGEAFSKHFLHQAFTWFLIIAFLVTFLLKFKSIRNIRKQNLQFRFELGSQIFWLLLRIFITGIWIAWIVNDAVFNSEVIGGLVFGACLFYLILYFYWLFYGKRMRKENEEHFVTILNKIQVSYPKASIDEISSLNKLLRSSSLYKKRDDVFFEIVVGSPARSFTVRTKRKIIESVASKTGDITDPRYFQKFNLLEWRFYFCVDVDSYYSLKPGIYSKSQFTSLFDEKLAARYDNVLRKFKVSKIEISENGIVIAISPKYDLASLGISIPSEAELAELFQAFNK